MTKTELAHSTMIARANMVKGRLRSMDQYQSRKEGIRYFWARVLLLWESWLLCRAAERWLRAQNRDAQK